MRRQQRTIGLENAFFKRYGLRVSVQHPYDRPVVIAEGDEPNEEFYTEIPKQILEGVSRYDAVLELVMGRWLNVKAEIFLDVTTNRIGIRVPYQVELINELKTFIPPAGRSWDGGTKTWYVNASYIDQVERIVRKHFPDVTVTTPGQDLMPVDGGVFSRLLSPLPAFALKAVYRAICMSCHPDRAVANGLTIEDAHKIMTSVNTIWSEIKTAKGIGD